jgi:hypothetical protein
MSVDPVSVDPVSVDPVSVDPVSVDPVSVDPVSVDPLSLGCVESVGTALSVTSVPGSVSGALTESATGPLTTSVGAGGAVAVSVRVMSVPPSLGPARFEQPVIPEPEVSPGCVESVGSAVSLGLSVEHVELPVVADPQLLPEVSADAGLLIARTTADAKVASPSDIQAALSLLVRRIAVPPRTN